MKLRPRGPKIIQVSGIFLLGLLLTNCDELFVERKYITSGSFDGLEIGASKLTTLESIKKAGVGVVVAVPAQEYVLRNGHWDRFMVRRGNLEDLQRMSTAKGIQIQNSKITVVLYFRDDEVDHVNRSYYAAHELNWFRKGRKRSEVILKLNDVLTERSDLVAFPVVRKKIVDFSMMPFNTAFEMLKNEDGWEFWKNGKDYGPIGSTFSLYFRDGKLHLIRFQKSLIGD